MVQGHSNVKGVSVFGEVLPGSLRPVHRLQWRNLSATLIISTYTRLMSRHLNFDFPFRFGHTDFHQHKLWEPFTSKLL